MEINLTRSSSTCLGCGKHFEHLEKHRSLLKGPETLPVREDYCGSCWAQLQQSISPEETLSQWVKRYYDKSVEKELPAESYGPIRSIFYQTAEANERQQLALAYLSAMILKRQHVFKVSTVDGAEGEDHRLVIVDKINNRTVELSYPELSMDELAEAAREMRQLLSGVTEKADANER